MSSRSLLIWILLVASLAAPRTAAAAAHDRETARLDDPRVARPLAEALAEDGTIRLRAGLRGTFDARGWRLVPGEGAPRFERAPNRATAPEDVRWSGDFSSPGNDDLIRAVAVRGNEVFVGGTFTAIGKAAATNVARWDGQRWSALGDGVDGSVYAIAATATDVYVGGTFRNAGGAAASNVARWDGARWSPLGEGESNGVRGMFGPIVYAIAPVGREIYVGGFFNEAGGVAVSNLAKWDSGSNAWSDVAGGVRRSDPEDPSYVFALAVTKKTLYVGGKFDVAGAGTSANFIAALDLKRQTWFALGDGMNEWVTNIAVQGKNVYAGGFFTQAGNKQASHVARWDGKTWTELAGGLSVPDANGQEGVRVKGLAVVGKSLYVSGFFTYAGATKTAGVARWTGKDWEGLDGGLEGGHLSYYPGDVHAMAATRTDVYVAGGFDDAGGVEAYGLARWSVKKGEWAPVADPGPHYGAYVGLVETVAVDGDVVYVGGGPLTIGGTLALGIAKWDGDTWSTLGEGANNGVNGLVSTIAVTPSGLVVGGYFSRAGDVATLNIARWDGQRWHGFGAGVGGSPNSQVFAIVVDGDDVYAGGIFPYADTIEANNIARWDGSTWHALGAGPANGVDGMVLALARGADGLYAGGIFSQAGGVGARSLARWNGQQWFAVKAGGEDGVDGAVFALVADGTRLYVAGDFATAGGVPADNVAVWSGGSWEELGGGVTTTDTGQGGGFDYIFTLTLDGGRLVAGGYFDTAGETPARNVAVWNGAAWESLGSGVNDVVTGSAATGEHLFLTGAFAVAGGKGSMRIARWSLAAP